MTKNGRVCAIDGASLRAAAFAAVALTLALALAACGGGGSATTGGPGTPPVLSDADKARLARLGGLREGADTLTMTGLHAHWSLAAEGEETIEDAFVDRMTCSGERCTAADGEEITAQDLLDLGGGEAQAGTAALAGRGGFDTVRTTGAVAAPERSGADDGLAVTVEATATTWGFWGMHGFGALTHVTGPLKAEVGETTFNGRSSSAQAWAAGAVSGRNPAGTGSATWTGIAEASPAGTFGRVAGTATLTIEDLAQPRIDVDIDLDGVDEALRWDDLALADGRFSDGTPGYSLDGRFHGPDHEEAYGVFDTTDWIGVFGAKRTP